VDWKWVGIGALIMMGLSIVAGIVIGLVLGPELTGATDVEEIELSGGQLGLIAILNFAAFMIGGFIVGLKSAGRTILEPGVAAIVSAGVVLILSGGFTILNLIAAGLIPFIAGVVGGWLGEKRQVAAST
jgi:hypothetical protein